VDKNGDAHKEAPVNSLAHPLRQSFKLRFSEYEKEAIRKLDAFFKEEVPEELSSVLNKTKWPAILGGEDFKARIREKLRGKRIKEGEVPQYNESMKSISTA
jgi:hypothetical protein